MPLDAPEEAGFAHAVAERFDGVSVQGTGISTSGIVTEDKFNGCAQGAVPLVNMSDFLLGQVGQGEKGASR